MTDIWNTVGINDAWQCCHYTWGVIFRLAAGTLSWWVEVMTIGAWTMASLVSHWLKGTGSYNETLCLSMLWIVHVYRRKSLTLSLSRITSNKMKCKQKSMMRKAGAVTVHSALTGIYKIKKKVKFTSVSVTKLFQPVVMVGLGMSERLCKPIELATSNDANKVHEPCKPGKAKYCRQ